MAGEKENWVEIDLASTQEQEQAEKVAATPGKRQEVEIEQEAPTETRQEGQTDETAGIETEGAQKRIKKLVAQRKAKEEELARERAARAALEERLAKLEKAAVAGAKQDAETYGKTLESQAKLLEERYARAIESGDTKLAAETMSELIKVNTQVTGVQAARREVPEADEQQETRREAPVQRQQQAPRYHPKTEAFIEKHAEWWEKDRVLTAAAIAIAKELETEGFAPDEDDYYSEVEQRLRREMPHKFGGKTEQRQPRQTVSGVSRTPANVGNKVRLTHEEVNMAKRLGVTVEQYAAEKRRAESNNNGYTEIL